jgi:hypothetical protein
MRNGKATSAIPPTISETQASVSCQFFCWPRVAPNASPPIATAATNAPSQSNDPVAVSSRDSFMCRIVA